MKEVQWQIINRKKAYGFTSKKAFLKFVENKKKILIALNAEKLNNNTPQLASIINNNIGYPDGVGAVWALKKKGLKTIKIAGAEFWLDIIKEFEGVKSFYLIGSDENVINITVNKLKENFANINIVGYRNGYLEPGDEQILIQDFQSKKPDIIFIAMGSPKQEFIMNGMIQEYPALYMGLGGSFDVYSGVKKRAPNAFINLRIEWMYRLIKEPKRIFRQTNLFKFGVKVLFNKI